MDVKKIVSHEDFCQIIFDLSSQTIQPETKWMKMMKMDSFKTNVK